MHLGTIKTLWPFVLVAASLLFIQCSPEISPSDAEPDRQTDAEADTSTVEWIEVYFNMPADHSVAFENNEANDEADLVATLTDLIDEAEYSVDLSIYDLQNPRVSDALVRAKERGVRVRVVTCYNNRDRNDHHRKMWDTLGDSGIITVDDSGTIFWPDGTIDRQELPNRGAHMHHKFAVIDKLSDDPDDYYLWTASMNLTYTGPFNTNLSMIVKDNEVARVYREEFEMMWGSSSTEPRPDRMRFHRDKSNVSQNKFWVGDTKVEVYFSPMDRNNRKPSISDRIVELIEDYARYDARFIAFAITPNIPISQALWSKSARTNMQLEGVIDPMFYGRYRNNNDIWASPEARSGNRNILPARELRKLHHKTLLLDAKRPDYDDGHTGITISGSYNFSAAAEDLNDENILMIHSDEITNQFYQDFMGIMNRAEEREEPPAPPVSTEEWYQVRDITDGQVFEIELLPNFRYPVSPLGVRVPRVYAGNDSSHFYAGEAQEKLRDLIQGKEVKIESARAGARPENRFNRFHAYVTVRDDDGTTFSLNRKLLEHGVGVFSDFLPQHPDSIEVYKNIESEARSRQAGLWDNPDRMFERLPRSEVTGDATVEVSFPININIAGKEELVELPNIGPARAEAIIAYREEHGLFMDYEDIKNISGIGPGILDRIRDYITLDDGEL